ncbi:MAG TPA: DNA polymerase I [Pseudolabrys sp.]
MSATSKSKSKVTTSAPANPAARPLKLGDHLFLVDGSGYIFRAYHALPPLTRKSDGLQVNAVLGFCNMLWKLLAEMKPEEKPTHLAVVFDKSEKTFRTDFYPDYKAHRPDAPADLIPQFPLIREAVHAFEIPCLEQAGYEADDLIATYARLACEAKATTTIVSSDKDLMQLVGNGVMMYDTMKDRRIGRDEVIEKFGVGPEKVIEVQALIGDSTDNVPGVPGIGPKAAAALILELGSLEAIFDLTADQIDERLKKRLGELQAEIDTIAGAPVKIGSASEVGKVLAEKFGINDLPPDKKGNLCADSAKVEGLAAAGNRFCELIVRARSTSRAIGNTVRKLIEGEDSARLSKRLVTLDQSVPIEIPADDLAVHEPDYKRLIGFLKAMEFTTITRRVAEKTGIDAGQVDADGALASPTARTSTPISQSPAPSGRTGGQGQLALDAPQPRAEQIGPGASSQPLTPISLASRRIEALRTATFDAAKYQTIDTLAELKKWIARAHDTGVLSIKTEINSIDAMQASLCGIALAVAPNEAAYLPLGHREASDSEGAGLFAAKVCEGQIPERVALDALKDVLDDNFVTKIGHDIKREWLVLACRGIRIGAIDDTMLMSYVLDAGKGAHDMDAVATRYFGRSPSRFNDVKNKEKALLTPEATPVSRAASYAAEDVDMTLRLWQALKPRMAGEHVVTVYETLERPMPHVLARMEQRGISIDRQVLSRLSNDFGKEQAALEQEINAIAGAQVNPGSPKQLGDILFGQMGLPGGTKTKTGQWSTGARALEELAEQGHKLPQVILDWRQVSKLRSTYTEALPNYVNPTTHRVHTSYALAATSTGRLSSSEPNLQNIPIRTEDGRKIRKAFVASPGMKLVSADYSQIELRLLAEVADVPALRKAFQDKVDIHAMTASEMFGVPVKDMPPDVRRRAKAINFGIIYGISAFGLANQLGIEREEAGAYIKKYFERFPGIRAYMDETRDFCREHGYVLTLFGRKCHYPDIKNSNASVRAFNERAAINARLQGSAADIIRRAMIRIEPELEEARLKAQMLLQVHDELIFEVPEDEVKDTIAIVKNVMESAPHPAVSLHVPLQVDARAADNWDEAH